MTCAFDPASTAAAFQSESAVPKLMVWLWLSAWSVFPTVANKARHAGFCETSMSVQGGPLCPLAEGQRCRASLAVKVCVESLISMPTAVRLVTVAPTGAKNCPTVLLRERRAKSANTPHSRTQTTLVFYAFESSQPLQPLPSRIWDLGCRSSSFFMVCCLAVGIRASVLSVLWWPGFVSWPAFWASRFVSQPVAVSWELGFVF